VTTIVSQHDDYFIGSIQYYTYSYIASA